MKIKKILELHVRIMKIIKNYRIECENHENHENLRTARDNHENHENHRIPSDNQ